MEEKSGMPTGRKEIAASQYQDCIQLIPDTRNISPTLYHKHGRKIPGTESKITEKLVGRTTKRWRFYWWRHLLKLNKFHIDGQRFLQTVFYWQLHCCDFLFGGVNKAIYC